MDFIPLTLEKTRRTIHVRVKYIAAFVEHVNDDEDLRCTKVYVDWLDMSDGIDVLETPEEILRVLNTLGAINPV